MDVAPPPPALTAPACRSALSQDVADATRAKLTQHLPATQTTAAWPSCVPGLVAVRLANGTVAYTDINARYLILGLAFDTETGATLDNQLDGRPQ